MCLLDAERVSRQFLSVVKIIKEDKPQEEKLCPNIRPVVYIAMIESLNLSVVVLSLFVALLNNMYVEDLNVNHEFIQASVQRHQGAFSMWWWC